MNKIFQKKKRPNKSPVKRRHAIKPKSPTGTRRYARYSIAVPVKISGHNDTGATAMACTYEVSLEGCKIANNVGLNMHQLIWLYRNHRKAVYKVVWTSAQKNQVGLQIAESEKIIWDDELVSHL